MNGVEMVESWGRGMPLILKNEPRVQFRETAGLFIVSFERPSFDEKAGATPESPMTARTKTRAKTRVKSSPKSSPKSSSIGSPKTADNSIEAPGETPVKTPMKTLGKTPGKIRDILLKTPTLSIPEIALKLAKSESAIERAIRKLRENNLLRRIGPDKGGHWEVLK